ncbi:MgtC/SapB family protein [Cellulophaga sp. HaHa_2_95]|uniref:MgtC/SapB family protein n=1 Tax=unclassified Cellulophaga TaxID=2634405 RepID=UPI001C4F3CC5|nr:MgtC/SapB family protein [Cellulophaga sp. HaHa_2_95]QXP55318.1 MgtC/SapB family protein [Cellulophaga sp. HaHa_2_95]
MDTIHYLSELMGSYMLGILISIGIGLIIGLEREYDKLQKEAGFAGIRTFPIVTILGFIIGNLSESFTVWLPIITLVAFILFLGFSQFSKVNSSYSNDLTTDLALMTTFVLGLMASKGLYREAVATAVIITTLLSLKTRFKIVISNITADELSAFIKFSIIALLILPFLPNKDLGINNLINPFEIGSVIVIVSFLNFIGYFLVKFVGSKKGILLTALLGGLISSTAVTWSYVSKSKEFPELSKKYSAGILLASAIMFPRLALLIGIFNSALVPSILIPFTVLTLICLGAALLLVNKHTSKPDSDIKLGNPLNLVNAIGFGVIYMIIRFAVFYGKLFFGDEGLYYTALIAGLADTDAITISMAKFSETTGNYVTATAIIITAILSNMVVKLGISLINGSKETRKIIGITFGSIVILGILYVLFA